MGILTSLVNAESPDDLSFLHGAFAIALDDFAQQRDVAPTAPDAAVVAGALAVMARLDAKRIDPVRLVDAEREETAVMLIERCVSYAPLFATNSPTLSPWFDALAKAGPLVEAARDGGDAAPLDLEWLEQLTPTAFRIPAVRGYLPKFIDRVLAMVKPGSDPAGALWVCLRFRRWFKLSDRQRALIKERVGAWRGSRHDAMQNALHKLEPAVAAGADVDADAD